MNLKEQLQADMKDAMKSKDSVRKDTIQIVRAGVLQIEKDSNCLLEDDGVIDVISKEIKKRNDVMPDYIKSGRQDLIDHLNIQIEILKSYLPEQFTEDAIREIVRSTISEVGATSNKDMGKVMSAIGPKVKGKADNKIVSNIVKEELSLI